MRLFKELSVADVFSILNAISGFLGIFYVTKGRVDFGFLYFSALMDGIDGFTANKLGKSKLGKDLDSLADSISFGVFPALVLCHVGYLPFGVVYLISCVLRLARFNVLSREDFLGLPTTASALILACWISLGFRYVHILALILSVLMVSDLEYVRVRNKALMAVCGVIVVGCLFSEIFVFVLLLMLVSYVFTGVIPSARRILKRG